MNEKFEKWARGEGFSLLKRDDGEYLYVDTKWALIGWQASRKQALEEAAAKCDEVVGLGTVFVAGLTAAQACAERIRALQPH